MSNLYANRFVHAGIFDLSDGETRRYSSTIGVAYAFNNYECNLEHINALKKFVLADYPNIADKDIRVWFIEKEHSITHYGQTMLVVSVPVEDFISMRKVGEVYRL